MDLQDLTELGKILGPAGTVAVVLGAVMFKWFKTNGNAPVGIDVRLASIEQFMADSKETRETHYQDLKDSIDAVNQNLITHLQNH